VVSALAHAPVPQPAVKACAVARIAYVIEYPLSANDFDRYGIDYLRAQGRAVSVIDVGEITQPYVAQDRAHYRSLAGIDLRVVTRAADLDAVAPMLAGADLIIAILGVAGLTRQNLAVFRAISRSRAPYLMLFTNAFPGWNKYRGERGVFWKRVNHILARVFEINWPNAVIARLPPRWLGIRGADFVVRGGRKSELPHRLIDPDTRVIRAHAIDYERFRALPLVKLASRFAVFIDEYLPFHPDLKVLNTGSPEPPKRYFAQLRALFDQVERALGLEVAIAANPRADYADKPDLFGGRKIVQHATGRLVAESALVIAHRSTAIGFAVMAKKPLMIAATRAIYRHSAHRPVFDAIAAALGKPITFYDDAAALDLSRALDIDEAAYDRYMADFVKAPGSPDAPYWQIVLDGVEAALARR
jgi:hypothetical protein